MEFNTCMISVFGASRVAGNALSGKHPVKFVHDLFVSGFTCQSPSSPQRLLAKPSIMLSQRKSADGSEVNCNYQRC